MATEGLLAAAFVVAFSTALVATPLAIRLATTTAFYDHPQRYKAHAGPTPYLGGAAVLTAFALGAVLVARDWPTTLPILAGALVLWLVGTIDDRRTLKPSIRILATVGAAALLFVNDLGWEVSSSEIVNLSITGLWVVGLVNAFNLMDNIDGAACSVGAIGAAGIGLLAFVESAGSVAALSFALCGACLAFLRFNLRSPQAAVFLGDGGSMPIGFILAAAVMSLPNDESLGWQSLVPGALLVGLPLFDTALVVVSRSRRGAVVWQGARDHLTHRLLPRLGSPKAVCASIASLQALLSCLAIVVSQGDSTLILLVAAIGLAAAIVALVALEQLVPLPDARSAPAPLIGPRPLHASGGTTGMPSVSAVAALDEQRK